MLLTKQSRAVGHVVSVGALLLASQISWAQTHYVYTANESTGTVSAFQTNLGTGQLTPVPGSPFTGPAYVGASVATVKSGRFLYGVSGGSTTGSKISGFEIQANGSLVTLPGFPVDTANGAIGLFSLTADPLGRFLFVSDRNRNPAKLWVYRIDSGTGQLSAVAGSPFDRNGGEAKVKVDPAGRFVYTANYNTSSINGFQINQTTGALTPIPGTPLNPFDGSCRGNFCPSGGVLIGLEIDPSGRFLYVSIPEYGFIEGFAVNQTTGALTRLPLSPYAWTGRAFHAHGLAAHPNGHFLYATNNTGVIGIFSIGPTGDITPLPGSPFTFPYSVLDIAFDPSGSFLYGVDYNASRIVSFVVTASGTLVPAPGSPYSIGGLGSPITLAVTDAVAARQLTIREFTPDHGGNAGRATIRVFGTGFIPGTTAKLTGGGPDLSPVSLTVISSLLLDVTFDLRTASPGLRNLVLGNPDASTATASRRFTIDQGGTVDVWVDIVGRNVIRAGREQVLNVVYGNKGNVDAGAGRVWVSFPSYLTWDALEPLPSIVGMEANFVLLGFDVSPRLAGATSVPFRIIAPDDPLFAHQLFNVQVWREQ